MNKGFVAISTVLIVLSVVVAVATSVTLLSVDEARSGLILFQGEDNLSFVEGCVEDALLKARTSTTFGDPVGTPVNITRPEGTCIVTVNSKTGSGTVTWNMTVTSSTTTVKRQVQVIFDRGSTGITLTSWKEI
jgi:hypothetical protein